MNRSAIGLIETRGLVGAIAAADAAAKAAAVVLLAIDEVGGGLTAVRLAGDVASVQTGVASGAAAAARIGEVISQVVIPSPHEELAPLLFEERTAVASADPEGYSLDQLRELPVAQLRQMVRQTPGVELKGRAVSRANKDVLIAELARLRETVSET
jgi:ethanolamine utilization protein EutM